MRNRNINSTTIILQISVLPCQRAKTVAPRQIGYKWVVCLKLVSMLVKYFIFNKKDEG